MSKTGSPHGAFFGTYPDDQLQRRRPHGPLYFSSAVVLGLVIAALPTGRVDWRSGLFSE